MKASFVISTVCVCIYQYVAAKAYCIYMYLYPLCVCVINLKLKKKKERKKRKLTWKWWDIPSAVAATQRGNSNWWENYVTKLVALVGYRAARLRSTKTNLLLFAAINYHPRCCFCRYIEGRMLYTFVVGSLVGLQKKCPPCNGGGRGKFEELQPTCCGTPRINCLP